VARVRRRGQKFSISSRNGSKKVIETRKRERARARRRVTISGKGKKQFKMAKNVINHNKSNKFSFHCTFTA
jgi:hypothetical protein